MQYLISQEKKISYKFSPISIFILLKTMQYGNDIICKAKSNLCMLDDTNTEKQSLDLLFLSSPTRTCRVLSRDIWGNAKTIDCI
jgi:hypothetical protein